MMTIESPQVEAALKRSFKWLNRFMMLMWRLGLGKLLNAWPTWGGRIMVLTHTGRKTGLRLRTPLNYAPVNGEIYCISGFGRKSDWYRNVQANPSVEIWLPDGWWAGVVEEIAHPDRRLQLLREVLIASGFAGRLAGLNPYTMSDEALDIATPDYRILHIQRTQALTGDGGPGDLTWLWPPVIMGLLGWLWWRGHHA